MSVRRLILGVFLVAGFLSVFSSSALAVDSQTTLFFGSHEKVLDESGGSLPAGRQVVEEKTYLSLPHVMVMKKGGEVFYLHQDHLSSTRLITDESGQIVEEYDYYPYGSLVSSHLRGAPLGHLAGVTSLFPGVSDKLYTSQTLDDSTSLYYYRARYYNPTTAHFLSADSAEGPNRYAYVAGNPISRNDPSGNAFEPGNGGSVGQMSSLELQISGKSTAPDPFEIRSSQVINYEDRISRHDMLAYASPLIIAGAGTSLGAAAQALYLGPMLSLYVKGSVALGGLFNKIIQNNIVNKVLRKIYRGHGDFAQLEKIEGMIKTDPSVAEQALYDLAKKRGVRVLYEAQSQISKGSDAWSWQSENIIGVSTPESLIDAWGITAKGGSMELFWDVAYERYLRQFLHELSHVCDTVYRNKLRLFQGELGAYLVSDSPNDKIFTNAIGSTLFHSQ